MTQITMVMHLGRQNRYNEISGRTHVTLSTAHSELAIIVAVIHVLVAWLSARTLVWQTFPVLCSTYS